MKLDQEFVKKVAAAINRTWETIGSDLEACCAEMGEALDNAGALESCLDADRVDAYGGSKDASVAIAAAIKEHGYGKVHKFLVKNIRLV